MVTLARCSVTIVALVLLLGCDERPAFNAPLTQWDMASGYRFATLAPTDAMFGPMVGGSSLFVTAGR
jgi:hypothetical protein